MDLISINTLLINSITFDSVNMSKLLRDRKAISPVIATVILVAVAITVSVAVAYWMSGIAGQYTAFEKVEIQSGYAVKVTGENPGWKIIITLKNSGTSTATLINCFVNEKLIGVLGTELKTTSVTSVPDTGTIGLADSKGITIDSGQSSEVTISLIPDTFSSSGTTVNIKLHSASGMDYIKLIQLT
jgi:flagellin-like protein